MGLYEIKMEGEEWRYLAPNGDRLSDGLRTQLSWGEMAVCLIGVGVKGLRSKTDCVIWSGDEVWSQESEEEIGRSFLERAGSCIV